MYSPKFDGVTFKSASAKHTLRHKTIEIRGLGLEVNLQAIYIYIYIYIYIGPYYIKSRPALISGVFFKYNTNHLSVYIYIYIYICAYMCGLMVCVNVGMYVCMYVCVYACM